MHSKRSGGRALVVCMLLLGGVIGCKSPEPVEKVSSKDEGLRIAATNYPLAFFAEHIGAESVSVQLVVPAAADPASWNPAPADVVRLQEMDLILINGAGYEPWINLVTLPDSRIVNTTASVQDRLIYFTDSVSHQHGPSGEQSSAKPASTTWLDFGIAIEQARSVKLALVKRLPDQEAAFEERFANLAAELRRLEGELTSLRVPSGSTLFAAQPVYQYLGRCSGLEIRSLQSQSNQLVDQVALEELRSLIVKHPDAVMLWPAEPNPETRATLKELGVQIIVYTPAAKSPADGDFLTLMRDNVSHLRESLEP